MYILLLLFSTIVDFIHGKLVDHYKREGNLGGAKLAVASSVLINLGLLGIFKYTDFLIGAFNTVTGKGVPLLNLALPIGISFYTFQTMSYTIDVYRGKAGVQTSIIAFGAYVSMFPQLIAGPIVRYSTIAGELTGRKETLAGFSEGAVLFAAGLGKKVLFANQLGQIWNEIIHIVPEQRSILMVWIGIFAFGMQIYFDFSGYSDMALGLGRMFGFHFPENFHYPYESKSITEFWRRWHISLGTWFKEYVYFPLGRIRTHHVALFRCRIGLFPHPGAIKLKAIGERRSFKRGQQSVFKAVGSNCPVEEKDIRKRDKRHVEAHIVGAGLHDWKRQRDGQPVVVLAKRDAEHR